MQSGYQGALDILTAELRTLGADVAGKPQQQQQNALHHHCALWAPTTFSSIRRHGRKAFEQRCAKGRRSDHSSEISARPGAGAVATRSRNNSAAVQERCCFNTRKFEKGL